MTFALFAARGRMLLRYFGAIAVVLAWSGGALGQAVVVGGSHYASPAEFLVGTWQWLRKEPQQVVQMRFSRNGDFFFNNLTTDLIHYGRFQAKTDSMHLTIARSCSKGKCNDRNPPLVQDYPFRPTGPNVMYSAEEKWDRLSRE